MTAEACKAASDRWTWEDDRIYCLFAIRADESLHMNVQNKQEADSTFPL